MPVTMQDLEMNPMSIITTLVDSYHANPDRFSEDQAERLATIAFESGVEFRPETKKLKKFAFDLADTALFGAIPNEWRPERVGQDLYGESAGEDISGALGSLLGLVPAGLGAGALIKGGFKGAKNLAKRAFGKKAGGSGGGGLQNANQHVAQLPQGTSLLQLSSGANRIGAGANRIGAGAKRLNPAQKQLNPYNPADHMDDYFNTAMNQIYSRQGIPQPF
jgi:hypothetical protein